MPTGIDYDQIMIAVVTAIAPDAALAGLSNALWHPQNDGGSSAPSVSPSTDVVLVGTAPDAMATTQL